MQADVGFRATVAERAAVPTPKILVPAASSTLVARPRLLNVIADRDGETAAGSDVMFLCAPAGSGKTTLLAEGARGWRRRAAATVAWVSLDAGDNDIHVFWSAILAAIGHGGRWVEAAPLGDVATPSPKMSTAFLSAFIDAVDRLPLPVVLVLDDVHELHDVEVLHSVDVLLRHLPQRLRVVLAGRFAPALALPRLRVEGRVCEIDASQLAFSTPEAAAMLGAHGVELEPEDLRVLLERTEGWAAGLRLAAISLAGTSDPSAFIADFARNDRAVADYLVGEVLDRQEAPIRQFLLDTCVSDRLTADLAWELSGREDAGAILDQLERSNSFTLRLGRRGDWYRYHPMLREYLRAELARQNHEQAHGLHRKAAAWFARHDDSMNAIEHATRAEDADLTAGLLEAHGLRHVMAGEGGRLRSILGRSTAEVAGRPGVAVVAAVTALEAGDPAAAAAALARMHTAGGYDGNGRSPSSTLRVLSDVIALQRARLNGESAAALEVLAGDMVTSTDADLDLLALVNRGVTRMWLGNEKAAEADLRRALVMATAQGRQWVALQCMAHLASAACTRMDMAAAETLAIEARDFASARGWTLSLPYAEASLALGWSAFQRLDDATAPAVIPAIRLLHVSPDPTAALSARLFEAVTAFDRAENRHAAAGAVRSAWDEHPAGHVNPTLLAVAALVSQRIALQVGEPTWAADLVERVRIRLGDTGEYRVVQAVSHAARGRTTSARRLLAPVLTGQVASLTLLARTDAWILEACLANRGGDQRRAHAAVVEALHLGVAHGLLRPFAYGGSEVHAVLVRGAGRFGRFEQFAARARTATASSATTDLVEPLTTRELQVLHELPSVLTADEIAAAMFVSANTVKTHLRGIYRKLDAHSRREAIALARNRGLL